MRPKQPHSSGPTPQDVRRVVDSDGVVRTERADSGSGRLAWAALAVLLLVLAVGWLFVDLEGARAPRRRAAGAEAAANGPAPVAPSIGTVTPRPALASLGEEGGDEGEPEEIYVNQIDPGPGEKTGIHLFPPPGTKPIKGGILVPDGYALPPGYMRHYQTTDDGEMVGAILVFHPDYRPVDANGQPIPLPADRVVPPELAPPGMPIETLDPPPVRRDFDETSAPPR